MRAYSRLAQAERLVAATTIARRLKLSLSAVSMAIHRGRLRPQAVLILGNQGRPQYLFALGDVVAAFPSFPTTVRS